MALANLPVAKGELVSNLTDFAPGGGTDWGAALQAAIDALPANGGTVHIPPRATTYACSTGVTLRSGVKIQGGGRNVSRLSFTGSAAFAWSGSLRYFTITDCYVAASNAHVFDAGSGSLVSSTVERCILVQNGSNYSIYNQDNADNYINNEVSNCEMYRPQTSTVPGWLVRSGNGGANGSTWRRLFVFSNNCTSTPFLHIESNSTVNYAYDNRFEDITAEQSAGGVIKALSVRSVVISNVQDYDTGTDYTADLIHIGRSPAVGGLPSTYATIINCGRRGGTLGAGVYDINIKPGDASRCVVIAPSHSSNSLAMNLNTDTIVIDRGTLRTGSGATGSRPAAATAGAGGMWFDTTLGKPIWSTGTGWVDATGTTA